LKHARTQEADPSAAKPLIQLDRASGIVIALNWRMTAEQPTSLNSITAARWERLKALLLTLRPGQKVTAKAVAAQSGLEQAMVEMVLDGLTKATLFRVSAKAVYVRQRLHTSEHMLDGRR
jgi:hypothetical protein